MSASLPLSWGSSLRLVIGVQFPDAAIATRRSARVGRAAECPGARRIETRHGWLGPSPSRRPRLGVSIRRRSSLATTTRRPSQRNTSGMSVSIRLGPRPGDLGHVLEMHGRLYAEEFGYDEEFEAHVANGLAGFAAALSKRREDPALPEPGWLWVAEDETDAG